jgi:hypothetical protein
MRKILTQRVFSLTISGFLLIGSICLLPFNIEARAASPYSSKPTNIENLKNKILDGLFLISYGGKTELAFAGTYELSQSVKDDGYESLLVTSQDFLKQCFYDSILIRTLKLVIENKGKSYKGTCWGFGPEYVDLATIATPFKSGQLSLWDSYMPNPGGWLIAVYYVPGFGVTFKETSVGIVNKKTFILGIEKFSPAPTGSALIFNQNGSFVGILTSKGVGSVPPEYFKVHGAPLQCSPASTEGSAITNCNTRKTINDSAQDGVWTIEEDNSFTPKPTPSAIPTPSPTNSIRDRSAEGVDAYNAALDSYNLFKQARQTCQAAFRGKTSAERKIMNFVNGIKICGSKDAVLDVYYKKILDLRDSSFSANVSTSTINQVNAITNEIETLTEDMDAGTVMGEDLRSLGDTLVRVQSFVEQFQSNFSRINKIITSLPAPLRNSVRKNDPYLEFSKLNDQVSDIYSSLNFFLQDLALILAPEDDYTGLTDRMVEMETILDELGNGALVVNKLFDSVPSFYCKRASTVEFPRSGKCKTGFSKIPIKSRG